MADHQQYREGEPPCKGWYHCLIDDELEMKLYFFICEIENNKIKQPPFGGCFILVYTKIRYRFYFVFYLFYVQNRFVRVS